MMVDQEFVELQFRYLLSLLSYHVVLRYFTGIVELEVNGFVEKVGIGIVH